MRKCFAVLSAVLCLIFTFTLSACGGKSALTGWYLQAENGSNLIVTEDGDPISLSDRSRSGDLFTGLDSGDRIEVTYDSIAETFPGQAGVFSCKKLEDGSWENLPKDAITVLEELGYTFAFHPHAPAEEPLTVDEPVSGYCGNTVTEVILNDETYSFWGSDSVVLTDILINLVYDPAQLCRCLPEFTVNTEFGGGYGVNLSQAYARCETGQASLTASQVDTIQDILARNCT